MRLLALLLLSLLLPPLPLPAENGASPQKDQEEEDKGPKGVRFRMRRYPSLRFGRVLRVDFHAKFQGDFRVFSPEIKNKENEEELFDLHRMRVGIEGRFLKHFEYEVEREIREEVSRGDFDNPKHPWRDVYVNFRYFRKLQIRAGKFKLPFGMDQLTGPTKLDFIFRSRIGDQLTPGRDIGIVAHGRFFERGLNYEAGLFKQDGENARAKGIREGAEKVPIKLEVPTGQRTFAGRLTGTPLRLVRVPAILKDLELGGAFVSTTVPPGIGPDGAKGLRGRTVAKETFFPHLFTHGQRLRLGAEMNWSPGPFSVKGEFIHAQDERRGQSTRGNNLPDLISRGWYLTGTWAVTGENKAGGIEPRRDFLWGHGAGAVELAVRYEALRFGSSEHPGLPSRATRAANILGNSDRVWTFGVNWYWNRFVKIQFNGIREMLEDTHQGRSPIAGRGLYWMRIVRLQFVM